MPPLARARESERLLFCDSRRVQARYEVFRQKRAIAGNAREPFDLRRVLCSPIEARENASERPGKIRNAIGDDREPVARKSRRIAIGIEYDGGAVRLQSSENPLQDRFAAD